MVERKILDEGTRGAIPNDSNNAPSKSCFIFKPNLYLSY